MKIFARKDEGGWTDLGGGNRRRILLHTDELMMVEFAFDEGGVGAPHSHPHVQASYVAEGRFEVTVGDRTDVLSAGDSFIVPSNVVHGVVALEAGRLVDSFTPHRADFLA
ncbi:cupin domain-containing protein [Pseudorhizobium halotolerans]|uniref:Cupin domain-containing protein n=1 Tax=Pseudorhizobium halotolerans TaxID=1233081 RepID=A0ABN7JIT0_9HYPH|nr:cupin domain-containing protein [Pseudorhizobium halotolerans]CAD7032413.1 cupin domain-containing protein [Pseudorhizobium halotolerans]